jgi:hypothetical protein
METLLLQKRRHLLGIAEETHADRDDDNLARRHPEGPLAGKVLGQDSSETLNAASHGAVDHDGPGATGRQGLLDEQGLLLLLAVLLVLRGGIGRRSRGRSWGRGRSSICGICLVRTLGSLILEREVDGLLEVELDGGALPLSLQRLSVSINITPNEMSIR